MTRGTKSFARNSTGLLRHPEAKLWLPPSLAAGGEILPPRTAAATTSADHLDNSSGSGSLCSAPPIELQIVETAIVAGFGQQLGVGADFFYVTAIITTI